MVEALTAELSTLNGSLEREMAERRRAEREREQMQRQLMTAQEEERRHISRDLHDQMGQQITALQLALDVLKGVNMGIASRLVTSATRKRSPLRSVSNCIS